MRPCGELECASIILSLKSEVGGVKFIVISYPAPAIQGVNFIFELCRER